MHPESDSLLKAAEMLQLTHTSPLVAATVYASLQHKCVHLSKDSIKRFDICTPNIRLWSTFVQFAFNDKKVAPKILFAEWYAYIIFHYLYLLILIEVCCKIMLNNKECSLCFFFSIFIPPLLPWLLSSSTTYIFCFSLFSPSWHRICL